ncbi:DUF4194 domain-containing protein [Candidatus Laterigemmans baculatus]|uniref:DUF4194 domain-containing protein n=1 Tax=Candidatus Laterigemmans baculatus TaxID=2770505 RepID=UPI0013D8FA1B|nr:DUF4194 domain-containing protein [Candidatus Laterigemmans baculatus]
MIDLGPDDSLPGYRPWSLPAVHLLRGVLYADELPAWEILLSHASELADYFARVGLILVVDEADGLAYLRQMQEDEQREGYEQLPRLFRRTSLGYEPTLLCVLLRDEFRRFEDEDLDNERCVVETEALFDAWRTFFPATEDELRLRKSLASAVRKLEALKFVRRFASEPESWEVRRILKARLPIAELENLKAQLIAAAEAAPHSPSPREGGATP